MSVVCIYHDPFGRYSLMRETVSSADDCYWCGSPRTRAGKLLYKLFRYGIQYDDSPGRTHWDVKLFCCKSCRNTYYGL